MSVSHMSVQEIFHVAFYRIHTWLCSRHWETCRGAANSMKSLNMDFRMPSNLNFVQWESGFLLSLFGYVNYYETQTQ